MPSTQLVQSSPGIVKPRRIGDPAGDEYRDSGKATRVSLFGILNHQMASDDWLSKDTRDQGSPLQSELDLVQIRSDKRLTFVS